MKKRPLLLIFIILAIAGAFFIFAAQKKDNKSTDTSLTKVNLGWQTPWATQGQLTQILTHTDIAKKNGLDIALKGFESGAPLNEAALAGQVDVLFTADQPAATLLSKSSDWVIIGRLMYNRVSLYVPPKSSINTVADLRGKKVAVPFGTAAQKMLLTSEKEAGLDPKTDVTNMNLGIYEQSDLVKDPEATMWGSIDAMAGFDPTPAIFEQKKLVKNIKSDKVVSVIVMSKNFIKAHPEAPKQFLTAFAQDYEYYRSNASQANQWFTEAAKLNVPEEALTASASIEPNLSKENDIRIAFNDDDYARMQATADFLFNQQLIKQKVTMKDHIDLSYHQK